MYNNKELGNECLKRLFCWGICRAEIYSKHFEQEEPLPPPWETSFSNIKKC